MKRRLALEVGELDFLEAAFEVVQLEIGGGLADLHFVAGERERIAFERNSSCHGGFLSRVGGWRRVCDGTSPGIMRGNCNSDCRDFPHFPILGTGRKWARLPVEIGRYRAADRCR